MKKILSTLIASLMIVSSFNSCIYAKSIDKNEVTKITDNLLVFNKSLSANSKQTSDEPIYLDPLSKINESPSLESVNNLKNTEVSDIYIDPLTKEKTYITSFTNNEETEKFFNKLDETDNNLHTLKRNEIHLFDDYSYNVGDTKTFYQSWSTNNATVVKEQTTIECMYVGEHCTVWADADETNNYGGELKITPAISQEIANSFDSKWDDMCNYFGNYLTIPQYTSSGAVNSGDADLDGKLAIICYDINKDYLKAESGKKYTDTYTAGFFNSIDNDHSIKNKYSSQYYLNYMDCIHIDTFPAMGAYKDHPLDNVSGVYSTLMHEFEHLVQKSYGKSYETYINEGIAMSAEHLLFGPQSVSSRINYFNNNYVRGRSLTSWYGTNTEKLSSYASSYLLAQYLRTQYLQTEEAKNNNDTNGFTFYKRLSLKYKDLANSGLKSYEIMDICYQDILGIDITTLYKNFWIACLLKEPSGPYGFAGEEWANSITPRITQKQSPPTLYNGGCLFFENTNNYKEESFSNIEYIPIANINIFDVNNEYITTTKAISGVLQSYSSPLDFEEIENQICIGLYNSILDEFYEQATNIKYNSDLRPIYITIPNNTYSPKEDIDKYVTGSDLFIRVEYTDKTTNETYNTRPKKEGYYDVTLKIIKDDSVVYTYTTTNIFFETYKIYFRDVNNSLIPDLTIEYYDELHVSLTNGPELEGYSFLGWYGDTSNLLSEDITFTATYVKNIKEHYYFDEQIIIETLPTNINLDLYYAVMDLDRHDLSDNLPEYCGNFQIGFHTEYKKRISFDDIAINDIWKDSIIFDFKKTYHKVTYMGGLNNDTVVSEIYPTAIPKSIDDTPSPINVEGYTFFGYKGDINSCKNQDVVLTSVYYKKITEVIGGETYTPISNYNGLVDYTFDNDDFETQQQGLPVNDGIYFIYPNFKEPGIFDYTEYSLVNITDTLYNVYFTDFNGNIIESLTQSASLTNYIIFPNESMLPVVNGYKLIGWNNYNDLDERLSSDASFSSIYISVPKEKYEIGESIDFTTNVEGAEVVCEYYDSMNNKLDSLPSNADLYTVTAYIMLDGKQLAATNFEVNFFKRHKIYFRDVNNSLIPDLTIEYYDELHISLPNGPELEGYSFLGWYGDTSNLLSEDITFTATYVKNIKEHYYFDEQIIIETLPTNINLDLYYAVMDLDRHDLSDNLPEYCGNFQIGFHTEYKKRISFDDIAINDIWKDSIIFDFKKTYHKVTYMGGLNNDTVVSEIYPTAIPKSIDDTPSPINVEGYTFLGYLGDISRAIEEEVEMKAIYVKTSVSKVYDGEEVIIPTNYEKELKYNAALPVEIGEYAVGVSIEDTGLWLEDIDVNIKINEKLFNVKFIDKDGNELGDFAQEVRYKADIVLPRAENIPEIKGYKFIGWYGYEELADELESDVLLQAMYITIPDIQSIGKNTEELDINIPGAEIVYTYYDLEGNVLEAPPSIPGTYRVEATIMLNGKELTKTSFDVEFKNMQIPNIPIYRLYNKVSGEHLFTSKVGEYNKLPASGWVQEGMTFDAYAEDNKPEDAIEVYRLFNPMGFGGMGDHHYTKSKGEINKLVKAGWSLDFDGKPAFYVAGKISVFKLYDKRTGAHHYTPKLGERKNMEKAGWVYEGEAWTVNGYYSNNGTQRTSDENM